MLTDYERTDDEELAWSAIMWALKSEDGQREIRKAMKRERPQATRKELEQWAANSIMLPLAVKLPRLKSSLISSSCLTDLGIGLAK